MKIIRIVFVSFYVVILLGCSKSDDNNIDKSFTNLKDYLLEAPDIGSGGEATYELNIDGDSIIDILFIAHRENSHVSSTENYLKIIPHNDYEVSVVDYRDTTWHWNPTLTDTVFYYNLIQIPTIIDAGDTLRFNDNFTQEPTFLTYTFFPNGSSIGYYSQRIIDQWVNIGYKFIGFRNVKEQKLFWLKVDVLGSTSLKFSGCKYIENENELRIIDQ